MGPARSTAVKHVRDLPMMRVMGRMWYLGGRCSLELSRFGIDDATEAHSAQPSDQGMVPLSSVHYSTLSVGINAWRQIRLTPLLTSCCSPQTFATSNFRNGIMAQISCSSSSSSSLVSMSSSSLSNCANLLGPNPFRSKASYQVFVSVAASIQTKPTSFNQSRRETPNTFEGSYVIRACRFGSGWVKCRMVSRASFAEYAQFFL
jgi:hypothetical protein